MNDKNGSMKMIAVSNSFWKFGERFIAQGVSLIVSIILARILSPTDFGVVGIVTVFFNLANVIISGGLNTALIQKKNADVDDYSSVMIVCVAISIGLFTVLFFLSPVIANIYKNPILIPMIRVMGLSLPIYAFKSIICAYISSSLNFKAFFFATFGGTAVSAVIGITMALNGFGAWALIFQQVSNTFIDTAILFLITRMPFMFRFSKHKFIRLYRYGWKVFVSSMIDAIYNQTLPLVIGAKYSSADLSYYTKGNTFPGAIAGTTTSTLNAVLFPILAIQQDDKKVVLVYLRRFMQLSSFILFPVMLGLFAVADNFIAVILTEKWMPATIYLRLFCIADMFMMIHSGNCEAIKAIGRSDIFLKMEIIKKVSYFAIIGVFLLFSKSALGLALSMIFCNVVAIFVNSFPNRKLIGYSYKLQLEDLLLNLFPSVIMMAVVMVVGIVPFGNKLTVLLIQILMGMLVFIVTCSLTKNKSFFYLLEILKERVVNKRK